MHLLVDYITDAFFPDVSGGSIRSYYFCRELTDRGHEVKLITRRKVCSEYKPCPACDRCIRQSIGWDICGVRGRYFQAFFPGSGLVAPLINGALRANGLSSPDLIFGSSPSFGSIVASLALHWITGAPLVVEYRDPWIRSFKPKNTHIYASSTRGVLLKGLEKLVLKEAAKIIVTNPGVLEELADVHGSWIREKTQVIYHGANIVETIRAKPIDFDRPTILFAGRVLPFKGFSELISTLKILEDFQLVVCGPGQDDEVHRLATKEGVEDRVRILGTIPHVDVINYIKGADVLFLGLGTSRDLAYALPSKIFEYIACRRPILAFCANGSELEKFITGHKCGISTSGGPDEIAHAIEEMVAHPENYIIDQEKLTEFSRDKRSTEFGELLEGLSLEIGYC